MHGQWSLTLVGASVTEVIHRRGQSDVDSLSNSQFGGEARSGSLSEEIDYAE
jgi:hypothetical protein